MMDLFASQSGAIPQILGFSCFSTIDLTHLIDNAVIVKKFNTSFD